MEYDKEQLEQAWQDRFSREEKYISLLHGYLGSKQGQVDNALPNSEQFWKLSIEIFDLETNIKAKEHYLESIKQDKAQQEAFMDAKMKFIDENSTDILKKARVCIDRKTDRAKVLETLTTNMPERETPNWYARIWEINEHVRAAKVPTTEQLKSVQ